MFEEIDRSDFNPNISLELGYALGRRRLLLKDRRMPRLPTDTCGKIYRDFDAYDVQSSLTAQVEAWCEADLGLTRIGSILRQQDSGARESELVIYDSASDEFFNTWGLADSSREFKRHICVVSTRSE